MADSESNPQSASLTVEQALSHAIASHQAGQLQDAERLYRAILNAQPDHADAHHNLGVLAIQVASDAYAAGQYEEAELLAKKMTAQLPALSFGWKLLGTLYGRVGRYAESLEALRKAAALTPSDEEAHNNLGTTLIDAHQPDAAMESCLRAIELNPEYAEAHSNLGIALNELGRFDDAIESFRRALELKPGLHRATYSLGLALLSRGRYSEGWPCYEIRSVLGEEKFLVVPDLPFPYWRGESLQGKSLLLWPEQGFGDYVQFVRYARLLKGRGVSRLTVRCPAPLRDLLSTAADVDEFITEGDPVPPHDYWSFPLSLPLHFGTIVETIPATLPYLRPLPERLDLWRERMPRGFKVGLVWKGSPGHSNDAHRSLPALDTLRPLWRIPGITFVSLQKGAGEDEARSAGLPIVDLGSDIRDFADTAAIIDQLDLVICVDTAVAHVAGALGKPCWVMLPAIGCDWRWMQDRSDSPWYPGAIRLFRQKERSDWSGVVEEVAISLRTLLQ